MSKRVIIDEAADGTREVAHFDAEGNPEALQWNNDVAPVNQANQGAQKRGARVCRGPAGRPGCQSVPEATPVLSLGFGDVVCSARWAAGRPPASGNCFARLTPACR